MTQTKKARMQLSDEARRDFNRRFCEVLAEGFENDLIPTDLHNAVADGITELITDHAGSMALEARLLLPIALDNAQRVEASKAARLPEEPAAEAPAWARPLRDGLIAALEDERLPKDAKAALGESVVGIINRYADMGDAATVRQFFMSAVVNACHQSKAG